MLYLSIILSSFSLIFSKVSMLFSSFKSCSLLSLLYLLFYLISGSEGTSFSSFSILPSIYFLFFCEELMTSNLLMSKVVYFRNFVGFSVPATFSDLLLFKMAFSITSVSFDFLYSLHTCSIPSSAKSLK